ncbi:DUF4865 family protein [Methylobacterium oryzae CBMB20]
MLIARYRHRLPADYAMDRIRARVAARAPAWDAVPGLVFKALTIEDRARGAADNAYSSSICGRMPAPPPPSWPAPGSAP